MKSIKNINISEAHMDIKNLTTFVHVAELGSFSRAAERLGYSQPTISVQIRQLELELGFRLFDRIGHAVRLTDRGRDALLYAQQVCQLCEQMSLGTRENETKETLAQYGSAICDYREKAIREIEKYAAHFTGEITGGKETLSFSYMPGVKGDYHDIDAYIAQLERNFERELEHGMTLVGPHRDDFVPCLSGKSLRRFGSQGQVRTCVIATKLAECEVIKEFMGEYPVLLLDDILSELDEGRRAYLLGNISDKQVFLTCTEPERISNDAAYFKIENGRIIQ